MADFTTVLKLDANNVNAYFNRGSAYDSLGQYEKAVADYTHALDLDSSSSINPDKSAGEWFVLQCFSACQCMQCSADVCLVGAVQAKSENALTSKLWKVAKITYGSNIHAYMPLS